MKRCVIFGGGQIGDPEQIKNLVRQEDYLICADSGYRHCVQLGFSPQLVLGDFDSYAGVVQSDCELLRYPIEKDDTDTMLAVKQALQRGYERLVLVGMLGGAVWCLGTAFSYIAAGKAGAAISYALGQGAPMVAAVWGVFVWKEFRGAGRSVGWLLAVMFLFFILGLACIILSGGN